MELGVVEGETGGEDLREEVERRESSVVIVDVVLEEETRSKRKSAFEIVFGRVVEEEAHSQYR